MSLLTTAPALWANGPSGWRAQGPEQGGGWPECGHCGLQGRGGHLSTEVPGPSPLRPATPEPQEPEPHSPGGWPLPRPRGTGGETETQREAPGPTGPATTYTLPAWRGGGGGQVPEGCGGPPALSVPVGNFPNCSRLPLGQDIGGGRGGEGGGPAGGQGQAQQRAPAQARHASRGRSSQGPRSTVWPGRSPQLPTPWSPGTQHCGPRCSACRPGAP